MVLFSDRLARSFVLATNRFADQIDPGRETWFIIAISEKWFDVAFSDIECRGVWQRAFQAVADLDEHFAILCENKEHHPIAAVLLTNTPCLRHALRVVSNV